MRLLSAVVLLFVFIKSNGQTFPNGMLSFGSSAFNTQEGSGFGTSDTSFNDKFKAFQQSFLNGASGSASASIPAMRTSLNTDTNPFGNLNCQLSCTSLIQQDGCDCSATAPVTGIFGSNTNPLSSSSLLDTDTNWKDFIAKFPKLDNNFLNSAFSSASMSSSSLFGNNNAFNFPVMKPFTSPGSLAGEFSFSRPESSQNILNAFTLEGFSKSISNQLGLSNNQITDGLSTLTVGSKKKCISPEDRPVIPLDNPFADPSKLPACARDKYRRHDGSCNNPAFLQRGKESAVYQRFLPPAYADGLSTPRKARQRELPNARLISRTIVGLQNNPSPVYTHMMSHFGQFLAHDLTSRPTFKSPSGDSPFCCGANNTHPECFHIDIPANDRFFSRFGQTCMEFVRSTPGTRTGCTLGFREQFNQNSAYIDGSQIYGTTNDRVNELRLKQNGLLKVGKSPGTSNKYVILPPKVDQLCQKNDNNRPCFNAGDERVNVQIGLTSLQTMFMRYHNNIATKLQSLNPSWNDETLYQEARAIVIAQLQHIIYNEYLPILLGEKQMAAKGLELMRSGRFTYDINTNPTIWNEFAAAAFRIGHTMISGTLHQISSHGRVLGAKRVQDTFFKTGDLYTDNMADELINGLCQDPGKIAENNVVGDLSEQLYRNNDPFGQDLVSINIQRGRDHGFPGYMRYRAFCKLPIAKTFPELKDMGILRDGVAEGFQSLYERVEDIDLYIAGISEQPLPDAVVGPTFACLIAEQFRALRAGDRFWYENDLPIPSRFSDGQLNEIRRATLAGIICNVDPVKQIQPWVLQIVSSGPPNTLTSCENIPVVDLTAWQTA